MSGASLFRLLLLSAIWGGSFMFMRIAVPTLGPVMLMAFRFAAATAFLTVVVLALRRPRPSRRYWRNYAVQGILGAVIPFFLYGFAAKTLPASILSVLNATAPIWGAVLGAIFARHRPTPTTLAGLALGVLGVAILVGLDPSMLRPGAGLAVAAAAGATFCYSLVSFLIKREMMLDPLATALGCMAVSLAASLPFVPFFWPAEMPSLGVLASAVTLGVVCSGLAYQVYFRLIADIGAASALCVTFLIPVFGVLWGAVFLGEHVGLNTIIGAGVTIAGTMLVTGFRPRWTRGTTKTEAAA